MERQSGSGPGQPETETDLTDIYGRRIFYNNLQNSFQDTNENDVESDLQLVRRLQGSLEIPKKIEEHKEKDEQVILTYAETLHRGLKIMWVPMVFLGRLPFRLLLKHNRASIVVRKTSPAYISCFATCVLTWILFLWITFGILLLLGYDRDASEKRGFAQHYWTDLFIFWTTLLQACISTTHFLYQAEDFAMFIKAWYRVLDITKIEVSKTLKQYIICSQIILCIFILAMVIMFCLPTMFDDLQGTTWLIILALREPIDAFHKDTEKKQIKSAKMLAPIGLCVYLIAIAFSWLYIMQFMVFCRCFRKGLTCINERIAMILNVDDVQRVGPNALRLTYEYIHKDYLGIATTGIKIGRIFSWTICNYYLWAILVLVVELGEIFRFTKLDYRDTKARQYNVSAAGFSGIIYTSVIPLPVQQVINELLHLSVTTFCIFYVSYEGSGAHKEGKMSYELARYKGLVDCTTQLERNFIRSIWIIVSDKCPVHVAPGKFFGITNSTLLTVYATAFTYFIFWAQSQGHFVYAGSDTS